MKNLKRYIFAVALSCVWGVSGSKQAIVPPVQPNTDGHMMIQSPKYKTANGKDVYEIAFPQSALESIRREFIKQFPDPKSGRYVIGQLRLQFIQEDPKDPKKVYASKFYVDINTLPKELRFVKK